MLCDVWYDIFYPVGGDFGLFYAGNGGSNPAKLDDLCDFFESRRAVSGNLCYVVLLCAGWLLDGLWPIVDLLRILPGEEKKRKQNIGKRLSVGLEHCVKYYGLC